MKPRQMRVREFRAEYVHLGGEESTVRSLNKTKVDNKVNATLYDISDDLTHKSKENYTLKHFQERINIYNEEEFDYEIHNINLKD